MTHPYAETYDTDGEKKLEYPKVNWAKPKEKDEPEDFGVRLCKDCAHYEQKVIGKEGISTRDFYNCKIAFIPDYVQGNNVQMKCDHARDPEGPCGPEGRYWEAKS